MNEKQARRAIEQEKGRRLFMSTLPMNQAGIPRERTGRNNRAAQTDCRYMDTEKIAGASFFRMHYDEVVHEVVSYLWRQAHRIK
ncbi:MAG: hypothetical protein U0670_25050 [Anaerolineae bacterium]